MDKQAPSLGRSKLLGSYFFFKAAWGIFTSWKTKKLSKNDMESDGRIFSFFYNVTLTLNIEKIILRAK